LAKTIASLDFLSGDRVVVGAGFGWNREEMIDHGVDPSTRKEALAEYLAAMRSLWQDDVASHQGRFANFEASWSWPKPVQSPLPVILGAGGTEQSFRWLVDHADGWISTPREGDTNASVKRLVQIWDEAGRAGRPEVVVLEARPDAEKIAEWERIGVTEVMYGLPDKDEDEVLAYIERRGSFIRQFAG